MINALLVVSALACAQRSEQPPAASPVAFPGLPAPIDRVALLPAVAGRAPRIDCSGWALTDSVGFDLARDEIAAIDERVLARTESLFVILRSQERFASLSPAATYVRQYAGLLRATGRFAYLHAFDPLSFEDLPGFSLPWESLQREPFSICDAGSAVFGILINLQTGELSRLEFSHSFAGRVTY